MRRFIPYKLLLTIVYVVQNVTINNEGIQNLLNELGLISISVITITKDIQVFYHMTKIRRVFTYPTESLVVLKGFLDKPNLV